MAVLKLVLALFAIFAVLAIHDVLGEKSAFRRLQGRRTQEMSLDFITCPMLSSLVAAELLVPDKEGVVDALGMKKALSALGLPPGFVCVFLGNDKIAGAFDYLNVFKMESGPLEHLTSTGIRDPVLDPSLFKAWETFADEDGMYGIDEINEVAKYYDENSNDFNKNHFATSAIILPIQMQVLTQDFTFETKLSLEEWKDFMLFHKLPKSMKLTSEFEYFSCGGDPPPKEWSHLHD